jgi:hypothetical protein
VSFFGAKVCVLEDYARRDVSGVRPLQPDTCSPLERRKLQSVALTVWQEVAAQPAARHLSSTAHSLWQCAASIPTVAYSATYYIVYHALWEPVTPTGLVFSLYRLGLDA